MKFRLLFPLAILTAFGCPNVRGADAPDEQALARAVGDLAADGFAQREEAMNRLWSAGRSAEPYLRSALKHRDAEVRLRAKSILDRFQFGIYADTPDETVQLIRRFKKGDRETRRDAMRQLVEADSLETILALAAAETDDALRSEWNQNVDNVVMRRVPALLDQGNTHEAERLLELTANTDDGIRHWASYWLLTGQVDSQIANLRQRSPSSENSRRLVYLWRARGDLERAREAAAQVSPELLAEILYEQRDWHALLKLEQKAPSVLWESAGQEIERLGYAAAFQDRAGNGAEFEKQISAIQSLAQSGQGNYWYCAETLLINECWDEAVEVLLTENTAAAFQVLSFQQRYREAFAAVGVAYPDGFSPQWFGSVAQDVSKNPRNANDRLRIAVYAARTLCNLGERDRAQAAFAQLAGVVRSDQDGRRMRQICEAEFKAGLIESALQHAALCLTKDTRPYVLNILFSKQSDLANRWWDFQRERGDHRSMEQRLHRLWDLLHPTRPLRSSSEAAQSSEEMIAAAEKYTSGLPSPQQSSWYETLGQTCRLRGDHVRARQFLETAAPTSCKAAMVAGDLCARQDDWLAAAAWYERAWESQHEPLSLFMRGRALTKAGRDEEGRRLVESALLAPLASSARHAMASGMQERGYRQEAAEQWRTILRTGAFRDWHVNDAAKNLGNAVNGKDTLAAADCWETMLLSCLKTKSAFIEIQGYVQIPHLVHKARALGLLAEGRTDGVASELRKAQAAWPGNISLAEDLVPLLDKNGNEEIADTLFDETFAHVSEICDDFPRSALHHNNLAWLAARCERQLAAALKHAHRAVQLMPDSPAYLDTLGEVHFRLGNRDEAIRCAQQCLEMNPEDRHFRSQLARFRRVEGEDSHSGPLN